MALFQHPPRNEEEVAANAPLEISPEEVQGFDEEAWYARAYRGDSVQLTVRAVLMGSVLGFFLSFTNIYIGLKTGWFLGVALTACISSFAIWSVFLKTGLAKTPMTILENTCMASTASSAGYATGNTLVTAIPAMLLLSVNEQNPKGTQPAVLGLAAWVLSLALLGVVMAIPMKRNMINHERLRFPSGTAAAVTLQGLYSAGSEAMVKAKALVWGGLVGVLVPLLKDLEFRKVMAEGGKIERHALLPGQSNIFDFLGKSRVEAFDAKLGQMTTRELLPSDWLVRLDHSLVLLAAGALVGLRTTSSMVVGALILPLWLGPVAMAASWVSPAGKTIAAVTRAGAAWKEIGIWVGAPMMVAYGLVMFALEWRTIARAFSGLSDKAGGAHADVEVPTRWFVSGMAIAGSLTVLIAWLFFAIPPHLGALAVAMTFFLSLVASRATGETDITPGGPLGKIVQLTYGVLMPQSTTANLMTAAVTSGSSLACADLLNDLKSGYLLGAHPRRQFIAQLLGVGTGTVASMLGYFLLVPNASVLLGEGDKAPAFSAPGAQQWKAVAELFKVGLDNLHPMARQAIVVGAIVGVLLAVGERVLGKHKKWLPSATGLGLGLLLPFFSSFSMFLGALVAWVFERVSPKQAERFVVPVSSGMIAGESIIGVVVAGLNNFVFGA